MVTNHLADKFGVIHESPQLLIIENGDCVFDCSHSDISVSAIETKLQKQEEFKKRFTWTVGIIIGIGVLLQYLTTLYRNIK